MSDNLVKSLTQLIDETLTEIETLKKSRFDTSMIELGDEKANGSVDTTCAKAEDEKEEEKEEEKKEEVKEEAEKAECAKSDDEDEDDKEEDEDEEVAKAEAALKLVKEKFAMKKAEKAKKIGINVEKMEDIKKSMDDRISPLEKQISQLADLVKKMSDTPVAQRGASFRDIKPLNKSNESEPLTKSIVLDRLVDLKKSGQNVSTDDVINAEIGSMEDLTRIATKYGIK
jgi:hypothetical protein